MMAEPRCGCGRRLRRLGQAAMVAAALLFGAFVLMGAMGIPRAWVAWMTAADAALGGGAPRVIVVLGGGGIPSETGLMRTYVAAALHRQHPAARYVCSLPADGDPDSSSVGRMRDELVMRGVPPQSVTLEYQARNTHEQAQALRRLLGEDALREPLLLVTSPSHARRALLCFRKAGFRDVACTVAESVDAEADMGGHLFARYGFWNMLVAQIHYARELAAMAVYKLRGWI